MLRRLLNVIRGSKQTPQIPDRDDSLKEELGFWRQWFLTKGLEWPDDYKRRFNPDLELQPELAKFAAQIATPEVDLLDVGAGPITRLGKKHPAKTIRLTPTDYLADDYNRMIDEIGVTFPLRTIFADGEKLVEKFGENRFDVVHAQNTLDHMERPYLAIDQCVAVARPGGFVYLRHEENEGMRTGYQTLHQWNFALEDATGHFVITHVDGTRYDITERTAKLGTSKTYREEKRVVFELQKFA